MSGGHFDYIQHRIDDAASDLEGMIEQNGQELAPDDPDRRWGETHHRAYPPEVIERFRLAAVTFRRAAVMMHHVDYLICGDHGEDTFVEGWDEDVAKVGGESWLAWRRGRRGTQHE